MPPSSESVFLRPATTAQRPASTPAPQPRSDTTGHGKREGASDFEDHVTARTKPRTAEKAAPTDASQPVDAAAKDPAEDVSAPKADADPETVPLTAPDDRISSRQAGTPAAAPPINPDVAVPEQNSEQAPLTTDADRAEQPRSIVEPGIARAVTSDTPQIGAGTRQSHPAGPGVVQPSEPTAIIPANTAVAAGDLAPDPLTESDADLPNALARTSPETASASPAVTAFRSVSSAPQLAPTVGPDIGSLGTETMPHASSGRGADWRLEAISGSPASALGADGRTSAVAAQPQAVAGQITVALTRTRERSVEIRLDPPELGRVQIRLDPAEDGLRAVLLAERPETQDFLRRHADTLIRDLQEAGYENVSLGFDFGGEMPGEPDHGEERSVVQPASQVSPAAGPDSSIAQMRGTLVTDTGLDIRL